MSNYRKVLREFPVVIPLTDEKLKEYNISVSKKTIYTHFSRGGGLKKFVRKCKYTGKLYFLIRDYMKEVICS